MGFLQDFVDMCILIQKQRDPRNLTHILWVCVDFGRVDRNPKIITNKYICLKRPLGCMKELPTTNCICVWNYDNLPQAIKNWMKMEKVTISDLDWVAMVPLTYKDVYTPWLEESVFGCYSVKTYAFNEEHNLVFRYHS